jgi:pyruvate dehydrogenase E2 component (dihydrolipoamide acetyltransferase)
MSQLFKRVGLALAIASSMALFPAAQSQAPASPAAAPAAPAAAPAAPAPAPAPVVFKHSTR